ncbi:MAG: alpha-E domain-containing protein [Elioraea sp.]|nr:alpha-E domain-containing protein [Elioraea sp.]
MNALTRAPLLARYAESLFWMARYLERVENLARVIDVTQTFESPGRPAQAWESVVRINADEIPFGDRYGKPDPETVRRFYLLDADNPTSIPAAVAAARRNARTLRPLISTEMWRQINEFHGWVTALTEEDIAPDRLSSLCTRIKEAVQLQTGITEGTFFRDQGWLFLELGRQIERADQTTRLLDIKYHLLLPSVADVGSPLDLSQWHALLRAAAGYHAFRRVHPRGLTPASVADFLLLNGSFPRSTLLCIRRAEAMLDELRNRYGLNVARPAERLEEVRAGLEERSIERIIAVGLHEFLDWVQRMLISVSAEIGNAFFRDWRPGLQPDAQGAAKS